MVFGEEKKGGGRSSGSKEGQEGGGVGPAGNIHLSHVEKLLVVGARPEEDGVVSCGRGREAREGGEVK